MNLNTLNEQDAVEWFDVCRSLNPNLTWDEFMKKWDEFQTEKRRRQRQCVL